MRLPRWSVACSILSLALALASASAPAIAASRRAPSVRPGGVVVRPNVRHDVSAPLRDMRPSGAPGHAHPALRVATGPSGPVVRASDTSGRVGRPRIPSPTVSFDGIAANGSAPPDTQGAAGSTNQYVEMANTEMAVYTKTGGTLVAPEASNTLWSGFGGGCQTNNDGDGIVLFDTLAQRWVISQFSVSTTPYLECVAVSTTGDATGTYNRYSFSYSNFPDYPKMGVWPDAYYATFNLFNASGTSALGTEVCAYDRAKMLAGQSATQQCKMAYTSGVHTLLPASLDGTTPPPAGEPEPFVGLNTSTSLATFKFHVDWTTPANSSLTGPTSLAVTSYSQACGGGTCVPQSGTTNQLDSLGDRVMARLAYRNIGGTESLVVSHAVTAGSSVGERWYEFRSSGGNLSVFQQGTYAPDSSYRWMGSIAEDRSGDIALGYSVSSSSLRPGVRYTGRLPGDAAGTMPQGEATVITGGGSQTGGLTRWGDYSAMSVDPSDDCTFWYANEYIPANGSFNWRTRVASFKFPSCGGGGGNDFSISANPSSLTVQQGTSGQSTISTAVTSGSAQTVSFSASGLPSGVTASFNPSSVTAGGSSTLTLTASSTAATGGATVTVTGTGTSATHSTSISLTVTPSGGGGNLLLNPGFESGTANWTQTAGVIGQWGSSGEPPRSGTWDAWLDGYGTTHTDRLYQTVAIPTSAAGTLKFWLHIDTAETTTTTAYDKLKVQVRNTSGTVLKTLATYSNLNQNTGYAQRSLDVSAYRGQTVEIYLLGTEDASLQTSFVVDDFSLT